MDRACDTIGEMRNSYKILVWEAWIKEPLRRPRHKWEISIKMDFNEIGLDRVDWIHPHQGGDLVNMVVNLWVP